MNRKEALAKLDLILKGIDQTEDEDEHDTGWWETSTGADFGKSKLDELRTLILELTGD